MVAGAGMEVVQGVTDMWMFHQQDSEIGYRRRISHWRNWDRECWENAKFGRALLIGLVLGMLTYVALGKPFNPSKP